MNKPYSQALEALRKSYWEKLPNYFKDIETMIEDLARQPSSYPELLRRVHNLKGSAGCYGFNRIYQISRKLEHELQRQAGDLHFDVESLQALVHDMGDLWRDPEGSK